MTTSSRLRRYFRHGLFPQLAALEATARLGSCSRAGDELCLSQPTVSVLNKKLAETLGVVLFEQTGKRLALTDAGRELLEASEEIYELFERLEEKLQPMRKAPACSHCGANSHAAQAVAHCAL